MENGPCIVDFPIKTSIYKGFSMAMLNSQMVHVPKFWGFQNLDLKAGMNHCEASLDLFSRCDPERFKNFNNIMISEKYSTKRWKLR